MCIMYMISVFSATAGTAAAQCTTCKIIFMLSYTCQNALVWIQFTLANIRIRHANTYFFYYWLICTGNFYFFFVSFVTRLHKYVTYTRTSLNRNEQLKFMAMALNRSISAVSTFVNSLRLTTPKIYFFTNKQNEWSKNCYSLTQISWELV